LTPSKALQSNHGGNDAQKITGIIAVLLFSQGQLGDDFYVPFWVVITYQAAMGLGTLIGRWRILHTVGSKITRLTPVQGCCASTGGAIMLFCCDIYGRSGLDHAYNNWVDHRGRCGRQGVGQRQRWSV
jgi:phosphate/sulfate permease